MVGHIYNKANAPYLIAGAFATLALIASGTLAVAPYVGFLSPIAFNIALPVALSLSILSVLVLVLSYKMISNNKKVEVEKNKFAAKEQELAAKTQELEGERREKEQLGKPLREKVGKLTQEKQALESRIKGLNGKVDQLKIQSESEEELYDESEGKEGEGDENKNEELEKKITKEIEGLKASYNMTSKNVVHKQNEKYLPEISKIDKALFDQSREVEKKYNGSISKLEEMLDMLEQNLSQGNTVQEAANSLEMIINGLSSEHLSEFERTSENEFANKQFSRPKPPTSTPAKLSSKNPDEAFVQEPFDTSLSPTTEPNETNTVENNLTSGELGQSVLELQDQRKSPKKSKRRSPRKENKENSWPQNQGSPNRRINNTSSSPLSSNMANIAV